jgi:hypothetical protein
MSCVLAELTGIWDAGTLGLWDSGILGFWDSGILETQCCCSSGVLLAVCSRISQSRRGPQTLASQNDLLELVLAEVDASKVERRQRRLAKNASHDGRGRSR